MLAVLALLGQWALAAEGSRPDGTARFLVMADPQFQMTTSDDGGRTFEWTSDAWHHLPELMEKTATTDLFVCGDIFAYGEDDPIGRVERLWDEWDRYLDRFDGIGSVHWVVGGHEFWGRTAAEARRLFLRRYPGRVRYTLKSDTDLFVLFDNTHSPGTLTPGGMEWLERNLSERPSEQRIWFFGHVPPRNTGAWWPAPDNGVNPDPYRAEMAALLQEAGVTATFFGHEHREGYLGDRGGFRMFVAACRYPLLVDVTPQGVGYRWIMEPAAAKPLETAVDALQDRAVRVWQLSVLEEGSTLAPPVRDQPLRTEKGDLLRFQELTVLDGVVGAADLPGILPAGQIVLVARYPLPGGWGTRYARVGSSHPYTLWVNAQFMEHSHPTAGRWYGYQSPRRRDVPMNRAVLLIDVQGTEPFISFVPHTFPPQLTEAP